MLTTHIDIRRFRMTSPNSDKQPVILHSLHGETGSVRSSTNQGHEKNVCDRPQE
jgi:hypothetical protein